MPKPNPLAMNWESWMESPLGRNIAFASRVLTFQWHLTFRFTVEGKHQRNLKCTTYQYLEYPMNDCNMHRNRFDCLFASPSCIGPIAKQRKTQIKRETIFPSRDACQYYWLSSSDLLNENLRLWPEIHTCYFQGILHLERVQIWVCTSELEHNQHRIEDYWSCGLEQVIIGMH